MVRSIIWRPKGCWIGRDLKLRLTQNVTGIQGIGALQPAFDVGINDEQYVGAIRNFSCSLRQIHHPSVSTVVRVPSIRTRLCMLLLVLALPFAPAAKAEDSPDSNWEPQYLGVQLTSITQHLDPFRSEYSGPHSLPNSGGQDETDTWGIYFGANLTPVFQAYLDLEMARGNAPGKGFGLGSLSDGDLIRISNVNLGEEPYVARAYVRYTVPLGGNPQSVGRGIGQVAMPLAPERIELKAGKFALIDEFDANRYANSTRTQFISWSLWNNTAWDYASDTRGYTNAVSVTWISPQLEVRFAEAQVVTLPNGIVFDQDLAHAHSENLEVTFRTGTWGPVVRVLAFENFARLGDYREAINLAKASGTIPDITATEKPGREKYGFGLNLEQPLAAHGETGMFLRLGWNDGATEDFMFAEVDQLASLGLQVCGCHWGRETDRMGIATAVGGLSQVHRDYLAAGGIGFIVGDGGLNYGEEMVSEVYYRVQIGRHVQLSPDYQYYVNPGYNRDRGPAQVIGVRLRVYDL
jgi:high affinity Mn2+ porin